MLSFTSGRLSSWNGEGSPRTAHIFLLDIAVHVSTTTPEMGLGPAPKPTTKWASSLEFACHFPLVAQPEGAWSATVWKAQEFLMAYTPTPTPSPWGALGPLFAARARGQQTHLVKGRGWMRSDPLLVDTSLEKGIKHSKHDGPLQPV